MRQSAAIAGKRDADRPGACRGRRLQTSSYDKNGEKRYSTEVVANNIILAGGRGRGEGASMGREGGGRAAHRDAGGGAPAGAGAGGGGDAPFDDFDQGGGSAGPAVGGAGGGEDDIPF